MIRLLGAITGSALALAALLVLVGVPQFKARPNELEQVVVTLPLRAEPVDENAPVATDEHVDEPVAASEQEPLQTADPALLDWPPDSATAAETVAEPPLPDEAPALQPDSLQWYAFWSPFRSEIAASGFVAQLQRVTGLDYRVVKIKPGVYEVAFAYAEDGDIPNNLSQISAATGLDMPGN